MPLIPWRVKNFLSEHFPLMYHVVANLGLRGNSEEHWDARLAETWDAQERHWPTKNALIASLARPAESILDVGCGNGAILRHLRKLDYSGLHGLEISRYAIERLRAEGIKMHYGALPAISLPDGSFDVVIASQVLEHIVRRNRFLGEVARVLRPGGRAFIFVPDNCLGPIAELEHVVKFDRRSLHELLGRHFSKVSVESMTDANHTTPILFAQAATPLRRTQPDR